MLKSGQILNDTYKISQQIGSGGGGIIYKAFHIRMRKNVAIKLIKDNVKSDIFNRSEVDVLKDLKNEYLPQVIDFVEDGNDVYTVMEFIEGRNFKQLIESGETFSEKQVRKYALQLCKAVEYLHSHVPPIIHSDIKPSNIMLTPEDKICLIDFNISTVSDNGVGTAKGGSKDFGAPEQFKRVIKAPIFADEFHEETRFIDDDETEILSDTDESVSRHSSMKNTRNASRAYIDVRTDIFGMGASIYYMLTSRTPAGGHTDFRGIRCSSKIKEIIIKCMNPYPSKRYRNVYELENALGSGNGINPVIVATIAVLTISAGVVSYLFLNTDSGDIPVESSIGTMSETVSEPPTIPELIISEPAENTVITETADEDISEITESSKEDTIAVSENPVSVKDTENTDKKIVVPSVINKSLSDAKKLIDDAGLKIKVVEEPDKRVEKGYVFKQSIASKTEVVEGTEITIYLSTYEKPQTETTVSNSTPQEWSETVTSGTMYITENCYSRERAIIGAKPISKFSKGDSVNVTALTDTGYYKLATGGYIHSDYISQKKDQTTYFSNGTVRSKITKEYSNGEYEVTWYWENGLERFIEKYDSNDNIINLIVISLSTREILFNEKPVTTSDGYYYTRKTEGTYPYIRCYFNNSNREITLQEYIDENGNVKITRTYNTGLTADGYLFIRWFENNEQTAYREYNADGTERKISNDTSSTKDNSAPDKEHITEVLVSNKVNSMNTGESIKLQWKVMPKDASQKVKITSSNSNVVSVSSDGTIKALKVGTTTIKVISQADNSVYSEFNIVVNESNVKISSINMSNVIVDSGKTIKLSPSFTPVNTTQKDVEWSVDDTSIAKIDKDGNLTAISKGTTTATVTSKSNSDIKCTFTITVN